MGKQRGGGGNGRPRPPEESHKHTRWITNRGGTEGLSSQGVSGTGGDMDNDEGKLLTPTCQEHLDNTEGGQPTSPMVPPTRHDGDLEGHEQASRHHHSV